MDHKNLPFLPQAQRHLSTEMLQAPNDIDMSYNTVTLSVFVGISML